MLTRRIVIICLSTFVAAFVLSCKTASLPVEQEHTNITSSNESLILKKALSNSPKFSTMSAKCTFSFANISSKAQIKMIKGEFLQLSFQPLLGIEMIRIMLTPDTIYVIDKIGNLAVVEPLLPFMEKMPGHTGITEIQNLIMGTPFMLSGKLKDDDSDKFSWQHKGDEWIMTEKGGAGVTLGFTLDQDGRIRSTAISEKKSGVTLQCSYSGYIDTKGGGIIPSDVTISLPLSLLSSPASIQIENISPEWNREFVPNTDISQKYERVTLIELINRYLKK